MRSIRSWIRPAVVQIALRLLDIIVWCQAAIVVVTRRVFHLLINAVHWVTFWLGGIEAIQEMQRIQYAAIAKVANVAAVKIADGLEGITMADLPKYGSMKN